MIVIRHILTNEMTIKSHRENLTTKMIEKVVKKYYPNIKYDVKSISPMGTLGEYKVPSIAKVKLNDVTTKRTTEARTPH
jgi:hypothetical protein